MADLIIPPRVEKAIAALAKIKKPGDTVRFHEIQAHVMPWLVELGIVKQVIHRFNHAGGANGFLFEGKRWPHDYIYQGEVKNGKRSMPEVSPS